MVYALYVCFTLYVNKQTFLPSIETGPSDFSKRFPIGVLRCNNKNIHKQYRISMKSIYVPYIWLSFYGKCRYTIDGSYGFHISSTQYECIFRPSTKGINFSTTIWPSSNSQGIKKTGFHMSLQSPKHQPLRRLHPLHILYRFISAITSSIIYNLLLHDVLHDPRGHLNCSEEEMPSHITTRRSFGLRCKCWKKILATTTRYWLWWKIQKNWFRWRTPPMKQLVWLESFRNDIFGCAMGFLLPDRRVFFVGKLQ